MALYNLLFLGIAVAHLILLGLYILLYHRHSLLGKLSCLLVVSVISYLMGEWLNGIGANQLTEFLVILRMVLNRIGNLSVFIIWLIASRLFDDAWQIRRIHPVIWIIVITSLVARSFGSYYASFGLETGLVFNLLTWVYSQTVLIGFTVAALYLAIRGYRSDLILERRKERVVFTVSVGILLLLIGLNRGYWVLGIVAEGNVVVFFPTVIYYIYVYLIATALILWKFRFSGSSINPTGVKLTDSAIARSPPRGDLKLMAKITHAMEVDKLYQKPQLTVASLAESVGSQEYRVRRAINNYLGFRNFSDFLNHYRIAETSRQLLETDKQVSNIGFDVGYVSLSSFYKAFRAKYTLTPKEYRAVNKGGAAH